MTAFDGFASERRWVAWRNEKRAGKLTKVPYAPVTGNAKADDPATWGTRAAAERRAQKLTNGLGGGVGLELGDLGNDVHLAGLDLDSCLDDDEIAGWAAPVLAAIPSYAERSPSGRGLKIFFCVASEDARPFLDRIGVEPDSWGTRRSVPGEDARDHGPAVEVYCALRFFAVTEERWPTAPATISLLDREQLFQLAAHIPPAKTRAASPPTTRAAPPPSAEAPLYGAMARPSRRCAQSCAATPRLPHGAAKKAMPPAGASSSASGIRPGIRVGARKSPSPPASGTRPPMKASPHCRPPKLPSTSAIARSCGSATSKPAARPAK
jgi:hypothetical protein